MPHRPAAQWDTPPPPVTPYDLQTITPRHSTQSALSFPEDKKAMSPEHTVLPPSKLTGLLLLGLPPATVRTCHFLSPTGLCGTKTPPAAMGLCAPTTSSLGPPGHANTKKDQHGGRGPAMGQS